MKRAVVRKSTNRPAITALAKSIDLSPVKASRKPLKASSGLTMRDLKVLARD